MYLYHYCVIVLGESGKGVVYESGSFQLQSPIDSPQAYDGMAKGLAERLGVEPGDFSVLSLSLLHKGEGHE